MEDLKELEIVFTRSKKRFPIGSWIIRWWTSVITDSWRGLFKLSPYSHTARGVVAYDWGKSYYQASEGKVNYEHQCYFLKKHYIVKRYVLLIPESVEKEIKKACYQEAGNAYATSQNLGIFITDMYYKIFHKEMKNPWKKGRNCSEIIYAKCFKLLDPTLDYAENTIKPHQIEEIILQRFVNSILSVEEF